MLDVEKLFEDFTELRNDGNKFIDCEQSLFFFFFFFCAKIVASSRSIVRQLNLFGENEDKTTLGTGVGAGLESKDRGLFIDAPLPYQEYSFALSQISLIK